MKKFDDFLGALQEYKEEHNNLLVPTNYQKDGYRLGLRVEWVRGGRISINEEERKTLNELGFVWKVRNKRVSFDEVYRLLQEFKNVHGNCQVPFNYRASSGIKLGEILMNMKNNSRKVSSEEKQALLDLGVKWRETDSIRRASCTPFETILEAFQMYYDRYGNTDVPNEYICPSGLKLGVYAVKIRTGIYRLTDTEKAELTKLNFRWTYTKRRRYTFDEICDMLEMYYKQYGDFNIPRRYVTEQGEQLGFLIANIRSGSHKLTEEERNHLLSLGIQI